MKETRAKVSRLQYALILVPLVILLLVGGYYLAVTHDPLLWR